MTIDDYLALYDWHSRHHTAHITSLRRRLVGGRRTALVS